MCASVVAFYDHKSSIAGPYAESIAMYHLVSRCDMMDAICARRRERNVKNITFNAYSQKRHIQAMKKKQETIEIMIL